MRLLTIVGARPQFIKAAPVSRALRKSYCEVLVHTGQHYDQRMSSVFFQELSIPGPDYNLGIGSGPHGWQTGRMLSELETVIQREQPDWVLVYGDTNSTLAGALVAAKLNIPLAHVEAGLRSFNKGMPEEINRIVADHCAQALFCPTQTAVDNLAGEGISQGVHLVGDVMYDAMMYFSSRIDERAVLAQFGVSPDNYVLATVHRAANTAERDRLAAILACIAQAECPVLLPAHPRTVKAMGDFGLTAPSNIRLIEPLGYLQMLALEKNARHIMTDSGGIQKEAYIWSVPCITLREETEWIETVASGWNVLVGHDVTKAAQALAAGAPPTAPPPIFGDGTAAVRIVERLFQELR